MSHEIVATVKTYWIAYGKGDLSYGVVEAGTHIATGEPNLETFEKYRPWRARVLELGGTFE